MALYQVAFFELRKQQYRIVNYQRGLFFDSKTVSANVLFIVAHSSSVKYGASFIKASILEFADETTYLSDEKIK